MKKPLNPFSLSKNKPTSVKYGKLFLASLSLSVPYEKKRTIRVYLPEDYQRDKSYPVMVMSDGQNLVDKYTSAYGDWKLDQRMHELMKEGYPSFIIVGIDCPINPLHRVLEYSFSETSFLRKKTVDIAIPAGAKGYGDKFIKCLVNQILPLIEKHFSTSGEYAIGGSSMGGVFALNGMLLYPQIFKFCLAFSPAYNLYTRKSLSHYLSSHPLDPSLEEKIYFYTGSDGFEENFLFSTIRMYHYFQVRGFDNDHLALLLDSKGIHQEATWSNRYKQAIRFWLKKKPEQGKM